ncbi:helix-turn-helix transcriptional regulator [Gemmata sp. G18]|uniref:Helix-turn-helix transcriptional regulator n=1 Tax=Gemmata palustris TaxID=2822762 RepID=A0ABS5BRP1_9BACT|nr:helix-turn-helix domain-containing protein [Gemmata palustris]MBP3955543.1 helix-turn-helix transcriptional regulator [Gemmata palustris]
MREAYSCGLEATFDVIGGKWKFVILWRLHPEARRFGELKRLVVGITEKMLIQQLREMVADGLVHRRAYPEIPPRVEYSLTPMGISLKDLLAPMCEWGSRYIEQMGGKDLCPESEPQTECV